MTDSLCYRSFFSSKDNTLNVSVNNNYNSMSSRTRDIYSIIDGPGGMDCFAKQMLPYVLCDMCYVVLFKV